MLNSIELHNFQSHKKLVLELEKFTTITGGSNSGKSAVLRAVGGLLRNDSVANYVTYGEKTLKVVFNFSDYSVEWIKGSGENTYVLINGDGRKEYNKVGSDIPDEISSLLRLSPVELRGGDKVHLNLHSQLESPFLLNVTPSYTAKVFGELTAASQLYSAVAEGNRVSKRKGVERTGKLNELAGLSESLLEFTDLEEQERLITEVGILIGSIEDTSRDHDRLNELSRKLEQVSERLTEINQQVYPTDSTLDIVNTITDVDDSLRNLLLLIDKVQSVNKAKSECDSTALDEALLVPIDNVAVFHGTISKAQEIYGKFEGLMSRINVNSSSIDALANEYEVVDNSLREVLSSWSYCDHCNQEVTEDHKQSLLMETTENV